MKERAKEIKTTKLLITYKDWLLLTRNEIKPLIGDKIKIGDIYFTVTTIENTSNGKLCVYARSTFGISTCIFEELDWQGTYVEIELNDEILKSILTRVK